MESRPHAVNDLEVKSCEEILSWPETLVEMRLSNTGLNRYLLEFQSKGTLIHTKKMRESNALSLTHKLIIIHTKTRFVLGIAVYSI